MALFLRPTRLASVAYRHLQDWAIVEDGWSDHRGWFCQHVTRSALELVDRGLRAPDVWHHNERQGAYAVRTSQVRAMTTLDLGLRSETWLVDGVTPPNLTFPRA